MSSSRSPALALRQGFVLLGRAGGYWSGALALVGWGGDASARGSW